MSAATILFPFKPRSMTLGCYTRLEMLLEFSCSHPAAGHAELDSPRMRHRAMKTVAAAPLLAMRHGESETLTKQPQLLQRCSNGDKIGQTLMEYAYLKNNVFIFGTLQLEFMLFSPKKRRTLSRRRRTLVHQSPQPAKYIVLSPRCTRLVLVY